MTKPKSLNVSQIVKALEVKQKKLAEFRDQLREILEEAEQLEQVSADAQRYIEDAVSVLSELV